MMDVATARQHDLRVVCIHEYAHMVVARHFGICGHVRIGENPDGLVAEESFFAGQFRYIGGNPHQLRIVGLAGTVAEQFDIDRAVEAWDIQECLECGVIELSATDAALAGAYTEADVEESLALVRQLWPEIQREAWMHERFLADVHQLTPADPAAPTSAR